MSQELIKETLKPELAETIKKTKCLEGFAREAINEYANKQKSFNAGDAMQFIVDTMKENCEFNFFGCNDENGEHLAFSLDHISEALELKRPTCEEICKHGCCAYINRVLHGIGKKVYGGEDEA